MTVTREKRPGTGGMLDDAFSKASLLSCRGDLVLLPNRPQNLPEFAQNRPWIVVAKNVPVILAGLGHADGAGLAHAHAVAEAGAAKDRAAALHFHHEERAAQIAEGLADTKFTSDDFGARGAADLHHASAAGDAAILDLD